MRSRAPRRVFETPSGAVRRLRLPDLEVLAAVAETGSISRGAARLGVSRPAVSQAVSKLEAAVGAPLLERDGAGAVLTEAGEAVLRRGGEAFDALGQALRDVAFLSGAGAAEVRVGASEVYIAGGLLADAIERLDRTRAPVAVTVVDADCAAGDFAGLRDRSLDVVLGVGSGAALPDDLRAEALGREGMVVLAGTGSGWTGAGRPALADLLDARWVLAPQGSAERALVDGAFRASGSEPPPAAVATHSLQLLLQLVSRGAHLSCLPASLLGPCADRWGLAPLPVALEGHFPMVAVTLRRRPTGPALEAFLRELRAASAERASERPARRASTGAEAAPRAATG